VQFQRTVIREVFAMRSALALLCVLTFSSASSILDAQTSWENLHRLKVDQRIGIVETDGVKHSVFFLSVSESAIRFRESIGERSIEKSAIRSITLTDPRRGRNALIGTGIGAGAGAALGAATSSPGGGFTGRGFGAAAVGIVGALIGAGTGAILPTHKTIYRAESR
jgi:hypothetical protein